MPNYDNGKIYKLWIHETDDIYIGSTIQNLSQRLASHKKIIIKIVVIVVLKFYLN
jgi:predicted GIY-YIG superfamily endonuclease